MKIQNIEPKRAGLKCSIRVMNFSGDDVLTTYDTEVEDSVAIATEDLADFWEKCITEHKCKGTNVWARRNGESEHDMLTLDEVRSPEFDLGLFEDVLIQPVPLTGG